MSSAAPAIVNGLVATLTVAFPTMPVYIAEPPQAQPGDFATVAWAGPDAPAVTDLEQPSGMAAANNQQEISVVSQLVAWQGDVGITACIARVYGMLDRMVAALVADQTLGGACARSYVSESALYPSQTGQGAMATLTVTVHCLAFR